MVRIILPFDSVWSARASRLSFPKVALHSQVFRCRMPDSCDHKCQSCGSSPRLGDSLQLGRLVGPGISHGADVGGMFPQQVLFLKCRGKYWGTHGFQVSSGFPACENVDQQHSHKSHVGFDVAFLVAFLGCHPKEGLFLSPRVAVVSPLY